MKVADVKLSWKKSPSDNVSSQRVELAVDGISQTGAEFGPEVEEMMIVVRAQQSVVYRVVTVGADGTETPSSTYTFKLGDLEKPAPATDLFHEVTAIRDEIDGDKPVLNPLGKAKPV